MAEELVLDTAIRDWVLIPLSVVMVLIGILRYFVSKLMRTSQLPDSKIIKEGFVIIRARNLRAAANFIPVKAFRARKVYYTNESMRLNVGMSLDLMFPKVCVFLCVLIEIRKCLRRRSQAQRVSLGP
ncbi:putative integral membrane protein EMC3/TMCO1 [Helianthus annuus]|nr:putative integral membrane protein EMC3/TMCO1 [Helianthus annuus]